VWRGRDLAAIFLALAGTKNMVLIDSDLVEIHNLNRTLFRPYHVGMKKVDALHELLLVSGRPLRWKRIQCGRTTSRP
jgi:tRNA A37 threonylcarbamoyladenosine dehydratase